MRTLRIVGLFLVIGLLAYGFAFAQEMLTDEDGQQVFGITPPRLSFIDGQVSFFRPGATEWSQAQVNIPVAPGDQFFTGQNGNLELQIATGSYLRGAGNTQLGLMNHDSDSIQFKVTEGDVSLDIRALDSDQNIEIDTPNAAFTIEHAGYYRVDVRGDHTSFSVYLSGEAVVIPARGEELSLAGGQEVRLSGVDNPEVVFGPAGDFDSWDRWGLSRTDSLLDASSVRYVSPDIYGIKDLDQAGVWEHAPEYGPVWIPTGIPHGWAPYSSGSWISDPVYGWTWVDTASWGWAPYHYGRWVSLHGRWAWAPGPPVTRPAYAPALVVFWGNQGHVIRQDDGPEVGWMALGWGEPVIPWWGRSRHPWWGGWGGPRHRDVERTHKYRNMHTRNSIVVVKESNFAHGPVKRMRVPHSEMGFGIGPLPSRIFVGSSRRKGGFSPTERKGIRPPHTVTNRTVISTRPLRSHINPHSVGKQYLGPAVYDAPPPRIVTPQGKIRLHEKDSNKDFRKHSGSTLKKRVSTGSSIYRNESRLGQPSNRRVQKSKPQEVKLKSFPGHVDAKPKVREKTRRVVPGKSEPWTSTPFHRKETVHSMPVRVVPEQKAPLSRKKVTEVKKHSKSRKTVVETKKPLRSRKTAVKAKEHQVKGPARRVKTQDRYSKQKIVQKEKVFLRTGKTSQEGVTGN